MFRNACAPPLPLTLFDTDYSMDEADILGDRIAIMAKGQLQCCGSSLFLKKTYGVGYQLVIEKKSGHGGDEENEDGKHGSDKNLKQIVTSNVEDATLLSNVGTELSFQLPMASSSQFTPMFEGLEEQIEKGTVVSYGVSITTLEGLFLGMVLSVLLFLQTLTMLPSYRFHRGLSPSS